jgi:hypothetical protein
MTVLYEEGITMNNICSKYNRIEKDYIFSLTWRVVGVMLLFVFVGGCATVNTIKPPNNLKPTLPITPRVALFLGPTFHYPRIIRDYFSDDWYADFEQLLLQGFRDKGYDPVVICWMLFPNRTTNILFSPDRLKDKYNERPGCFPELREQFLWRDVGHLLDDDKWGEAHRASAREAALKQGASSIFYMWTSVSIMNRIEVASPLYMKLDFPGLVYNGKQWNWFDLSFNWHNYFRDDKGSEKWKKVATNQYPNYPLQYYGNMWNQSFELPRKEVLNSMIKEGKEETLIKFMPTDKFLKMVVDDLLAEIPTWVPQKMQ